MQRGAENEGNRLVQKVQSLGVQRVQETRGAEVQDS